MVTEIIKRDGRKEPFNRQKIVNAISKAGVVDESTIDRIVGSIENSHTSCITVEAIQDIVEHKLMTSSYKDVAKEYIIYRNERNKEREKKSNLVKKVLTRVNASEVENANANVDEKSFSGREKEASSDIGKTVALDYGGLSKEVANAHKNMLVYQHDLEKAIYGVHNCLSIDFKELFTNGFKTRNGDVRPPKSFSSACQLVAVIFQCQSQVQFGGVGCVHLDYDLAPFVDMSFKKHYRNYFTDVLDMDESYVDKAIENIDISLDSTTLRGTPAYKYAYKQLMREGRQSMQAMYHNLNTLESRQGSQVPFTSINLGRDTSTEGRLVTQWVMEASLDGIGKNHTTSIFPISIFQYKKGVNANEEDKNYDLKQLALHSLAKRIYPNWVNCDWSQANENPNDIDTMMSTMGALAGAEHLYIKLDDVAYDVTIKSLFDYIKYGIRIGFRPCQVFYNKERTCIKGDKHIQAKSNVTVGSGVYAITYLPEDVTYIGSSSNVNRRLTEHRSSIRLTGGIDAGACFGDTNLDNYTFEVLQYCDNYKEVENEYIEKMPNINFKGMSTKYYKVNTATKFIYERPNFKQDLTIPQDFIDISDKDIKVLDRDNKWVKINHIFKNDRRNSPFMMHIYYNELGKHYCITCTEDHPLWTGTTFTRADELKIGDFLYRADGLQMPIENISWHWETVDSYDIGTATGSFIGSDVIMHNCRTMTGYDRNGYGYRRVGRGNNVPNTIILPKLGIEYGICLGKRTEADLKGFWQALEETMLLAEKGLLERYSIMIKQSPKSAPFMYQNKTIVDADKCVDNVENTLKHNTLAMGYLGIAEMCQALFGKNHIRDEETHQFALKVVQRMSDFVKEASERNNLNFSLYASPAEGLSRTALVKLREQYGVIENVTSREYITNSHHCPVWENVSIYEKLKAEADFCKYPTGGCITYVELPSSFMKNVKAVEDIINYAFDELDIPYLAFNFPIDTCLDCGHQGEFDNVCTECGSSNIQKLRRVTGYLTADYRNFNDGKRKETEERVKHTKETYIVGDDDEK